MAITGLIIIKAKDNHKDHNYNNKKRDNITTVSIIGTHNLHPYRRIWDPGSEPQDTGIHKEDPEMNASGSGNLGPRSWNFSKMPSRSAALLRSSGILGDPRTCQAMLYYSIPYHTIPYRTVV